MGSKACLHIAALSLLLLGGACTRSKPNVILVTFDTTRADAVGYAGVRKGLTPNLDALAAKGSWFSSCVSSQPLTMPGHATIFTGLYPPRHGVRNNGTYVLGEEQITLAERFRDAGYRTHAVVSAYVVDSQFGLDQGFETYDDDLSGGPRQKMFMFKEIQAEAVANKAIAWLKGRDQEAPFFLWLHFFDPHAEYQPPPDIAIRFAGEPYLGEVHYADQQLGRVLQTLDELEIGEETIVAFTSDHGESLGEHGERTHGIFVYDATVRVPLLLAGPGIPQKRIARQVRTADIAPTLLELARLETGEHDGTSLVPLWKGKDEPERTAYTESMAPLLNFGWAELRALRTDQWKVIDSPKPEAYDLAKDPGETKNLWNETPPSNARRLDAELQAFERSDPFERGEQQETEMDPELQRRLAALGYVWSGPDSTGGDRPRADAKDRITYWEAFQAAQVLIRNGAYDQAVPALEELVNIDPDNVVAMGSLATALSRINEKEKAEVIFRRMIELDPQRDAAHVGLARLAREKGDFAAADAASRRLIELQPENVEGYLSLGDTYLEKEDWTEAEKWFRKALEVDPHSSLAVAGLGNTFNRANRLKDALHVLREGRERDPSSHVLTYNLAVITERMNDLPAAAALYQEAIRLDPEHSMAWNNLGSLLSRNGKAREALAAVSRARELDPSNIEAAYNLGVLLQGAGQTEHALVHLEAALRMNPAFAPAAIQRARALTRLRRDEEALTAWRQLTPQSPAAWLSIAEIELRRGRESEARSALRRGIEAGGPRVTEAAKKHEGLRSLL